MIYQIGTKMLAEIPAIAEVHLEANNRTWDTVAERGDELGVYTDARRRTAVWACGCADRLRR